MFSKLFSKIIVPYDGSSFSKKALSKAIEVAHNLESEIHIVTVVNVGYVSPPGMLKGLTHSKSDKNSIKKWKKSVKDDTKKMLKKEILRCESKGISATYKILEGNVSDSIIDYSKKNKATLIVIGSQGLSGVRKIKILGSVSRKVSELASCPVLIIR
ncbi:MAG: universal stress protein [Nitrosopumilaceae archaeon]|nr:universal stress protein [Nitrosopumilaceae archaeon]NIU00910.1 universal stress protein [Nitrosopumilaceae archaeon]NIU87363.1 universal stress protein [Nitrosopumilaceae archaeon]NIV65891.1 universal stress protein [Nitrosopumilaceae archaeon]NIX61512.1 universal stress protein [Nitrosopumilaceae archaeon]